MNDFGGAQVPAGWTLRRLSEIAEIKLGKMLSAKAREPGLSQIPYLRNENVRWGRIDLSDVKTMGFKPNELQRYAVEPGDLMVCEGGEPGRAAVYAGPPNRYMFQKALHRVRVRSDLGSVAFLRFFLEWYAGRLKTSQTTIAHFPLERMEQLPIPLPSRAEQDAIVAEIEKQFTRLDAGVEALKRLRAHLRRYRAAILKAACEGRLVATEAAIARSEKRGYESGEECVSGILRRRRAIHESGEPNHRYTEPTRPEPFGAPLPEGWSWASVEEITSVVQYGSSARTREPDEGVPVLRMGNIVDGSIDAAKLKYLPAGHDEFPELLLREGDLLFNRTNSPELVGKSAVYEGSPSPCSYASYLIRARLVPGYSPHMLATFLNSVFGREWIKSVAVQQVGQANVNGTKLQALAVPVPPTAEQDRIVAEVRRLTSVIAEAEKTVSLNLHRAASLRRAILTKAFNGTLSRVSPEGEP